MNSEITKGDYSIVGSSKSRMGNNIFEIYQTGSGVGLEGVIVFQSDVLFVLEGIIRNHLDPKYSIARLKRIGSNPLFLFYLPEGASQVQIPSPMLLQQFLLLDNTLTENITIEITDLDKVKFVEHLSKKIFQILKNAAREIDISKYVEKYTGEISNSKYKKNASDSIFNFEVVVR